MSALDVGERRRAASYRRAGVALLTAAAATWGTLVAVALLRARGALLGYMFGYAFTAVVFAMAWWFGWLELRRSVADAAMGFVAAGATLGPVSAAGLPGVWAAAVYTGVGLAVYAGRTALRRAWVINRLLDRPPMPPVNRSR